MNAPALFLVFFAFSLCSCGRAAHGNAHLERFRVGFWLWGETFADPLPSTRVPDSLYVLAGAIRPPEHRSQFVGRSKWTVYQNLADNLPPASEYWMVYRDEGQIAPDTVVVDELMDSIWTMRYEAHLRHLNMVGIQLDIDSPTGQLREYAAFLSSVRRRLPPGCKLSITALLDWFRAGTAVGGVIQQVDEFVPQFYDLAAPRGAFRPDAISERFNGAKWGPVFNRFGKPFRIGISTFGRAKSLEGDYHSVSPFPRISQLSHYYADLTPLDLALNPAYQFAARRNEVGELVLDYTALHPIQLNYQRINAGDGVEFIVATPETVRAAVDGARKIGGRCEGIVFFRWPERSEALVMQPDEALIAAGLEPGTPDAPAAITQIDAHCAAVKCADIYLINAKPWAPQRARYRIQASSELEYFMPELKPLVRMSGLSQLEATLPPYTGRNRIFLGRAVSQQPLRFTVESQQ